MSESDVPIEILFEEPVPPTLSGASRSPEDSPLDDKDQLVSRLSTSLNSITSTLERYRETLTTPTPTITASAIDNLSALVSSLRSISSFITLSVTRLPPARFRALSSNKIHDLTPNRIQSGCVYLIGGTGEVIVAYRTNNNFDVVYIRLEEMEDLDSEWNPQTRLSLKVGRLTNVRSIHDKSLLHSVSEGGSETVSIDITQGEDWIPAMASANLLQLFTPKNIQPGPDKTLIVGPSVPVVKHLSK